MEIDVGCWVQAFEDFLLPGGGEEVEGFLDAWSIAFLDEGAEKVDGHLVIFDGFVFVCAALGNDQFMESERGRVRKSKGEIINIRLDDVVHEEGEESECNGVHSQFRERHGIVLARAAFWDQELQDQVGVIETEQTIRVAYHGKTQVFD